MKAICLLFIFFFQLINYQLFSQNSRSGKIAIGYIGDFTNKSNDLSLSYWVNGKLILEPELGFQNINVKDNKGTNLRLGLGALICLNDFVVTPYLGGRIKGIFLSGGDKTYNDLVFSFVFGGEYFITKWLSTGAEMRLNYISTDKEFSPQYLIADATIFETEQVIKIKIYLR